MKSQYIHRSKSAKILLKMSSISKDDVLKLAKLSRLQLSDDEVVKYQKELEAILTYVEVLQTADTEGLSPTYQVNGLQNVVRKDEILPQQAKNELLKNVPVREGDLIKVKRMIG